MNEHFKPLVVTNTTEDPIIIVTKWSPSPMGLAAKIDSCVMINPGDGVDLSIFGLQVKDAKIAIQLMGFVRRTIREEVDRVRHTQVIKDPFPEHTEYSTLRKMLGRIFGDKPPKPVSIWEAYMKGYDKAYNEIIASIGHKEINYDSSIESS